MHLLEPYDQALEEILKHGIKKGDRTGVGCISVAGLQSKYRLDTEYFPIVTGRKVFPKAVFAELLWFLSGSTMNQDLVALGAKFWSKWCDDDNPKYRALREKYGYESGDFGPIYGWQLRYFGADYVRYRKLMAEKKEIEKNGPKPIPHKITNHPYRDVTGPNGVDRDIEDCLSSGFDQLAYMIDVLQNDPFGSNGRRCLFSLWNPNDLKKSALPPCFLAGQKVLSHTGYKAIEDIKVGDIVRTEKGWKPVDQIFYTPYDGDVYKITAFHCSGSTIASTPNHPFLVKDKGYVEAKDLKVGDMMGMTIPKGSSIPSFNRMKNKYSIEKVYLDKPEYWYMMGYFIGHGWVQKSKCRVCFAISAVDKDRILPEIRKVIGICEKKSNQDSCKTYQTRNKFWYNILCQFGQMAHNKSLPKWVFDAPDELLNHFIRGYFDSDGCKVENSYHFVSTSHNLVLGIQCLCWRLGMRARLHVSKRKPFKTIEGRVVRQQEKLYTLVVKFKSNDIRNEYTNYNFAIEKDICWCKIKSIEKEKVSENVYNMSVLKDHTYTVNNAITHNCHYTYQAIPDGDGGLTGILTQRSCDTIIGIPANIQFYSALTIMLAQQANMKTREFVHNMNDAHIYIDQIPMVDKYLEAKKPDSPKVRINKAKDIYSYIMEDFEVIDYNPGDKLDIPVAV